MLFAALLSTGCFDSEEIVIPPEDEAQSPTEMGLGPGISPLSSGLGEKGSPSWSPSSGKIAYTLDGYVVEKAPNDSQLTRRTTKDFAATRVTWSPSGENLTILGADAQSRPPESQHSVGPQGLYRTVEGEGALKITKIATGVQAMVPGPRGSDWTLLALDSTSSNSRLARVDTTGNIRLFDADIQGTVTGISVVPKGDQALLATRNDASDRFEIHVFSLSEDGVQRVATLDRDMEVIGDPQWTKRGIYYVTGEQPSGAGQDAAAFQVYRIASGSSEPELAPGIGGDFVASNLKRDNTGERLAVIGRRNPQAAENVYLLDPRTKSLQAVTSNEDMDIKTGHDDLTWSRDGDSVVVVARAVMSEPKIYSVPADSLVSDFYNLYEVPVGRMTGDGKS
ncbi:hypothetical protein BH23ACT11_BH23ACT11_09290 [soil metagenome]